MDRFTAFTAQFANYPVLQKDLSLLDQPAGAPPPYTNPAPQRAGTLPPPTSGKHRPSGSDERRPRPPRAPGSPSKRGGDAPLPRARPRGMSDSSAVDVRERRERERERERERGRDRPPRTDSEERRRRERRRRERENGKDGPGRMKRPQGLDIIDKLDVTGIYGQGRMAPPTPPADTYKSL